MTAALLKQAREVLWSAAQELHHIDSGPIKELGGVIAKVEDAAAALDAHTALSPYDKAIHALAPYLPDGWVAQEERGWICFHSSKPHHDSVGENEGFWISESDVMIALNEHFKIPKCFNCHESRRRITHNSDGTVTVERG